MERLLEPEHLAPGPLPLRDPCLHQESRGNGVLAAVSVEVGDEVGEVVRGALGCVEDGGDQGLLVGRSHAPGL